MCSVAQLCLTLTLCDPMDCNASGSSGHGIFQARILEWVAISSCRVTVLSYVIYVWWSVAQSCLTLCSPMDSSPPGSSVHGVFQARILEWVAISSIRGSFRPRDQTPVSCGSCTGRQILYDQRQLRSPHTLYNIILIICHYI